MIGVHHFQYNGIGTTTITAEHSRLMQANGLHELRINMIDHVNRWQKEVVVKCGDMSGRNEQQRKPDFNAFNMCITLGEMPRSETSRRAVTDDA